MLGVDLTNPLSAEERDSLVDSVAKAIADRKLEVPAVLFLEAHKPLSFIASQSVFVAVPFLGPLIGAQRIADFGKLLGDRANIDLLIARIEDMASAGAESQEYTPGNG